MENREREARMLAEAKQRQQRVVGRINQIEAQKQQLEMERAQLTQEALRLLGRIDTLQELAQEPPEEEESVKDNVTEFPTEKAPKGKKGKGGSKGPAKD